MLELEIFCGLMREVPESKDNALICGAALEKRPVQANYDSTWRVIECSDN